MKPVISEEGFSNDTKEQILIAENVKVDIEDLRLATGWSFFNRVARSNAAMKIVEAVIKGLSSQDRERLEGEDDL